jgi:predicted esterase
MITSVQSQLPGGFQALVFSPTSTDQTAACIVWLHGIGERGGDLSLVAKYGLPAALDQRRARINATVLCPQLESDGEWEPARIAELMAQVRKQYAHTALVGFSLGALGVCETVAELGPQSNLHVAIAPRTRHLPTLPQKGTRLLSISGEHDRWPTTAEYLRQLRDLGAVVEEVVLPDEGHFISESALWHPSSVTALQTLGIQLTACS